MTCAPTPAASCSSALSWTAYVYWLAGGRGAGIDNSPLSPTVYSVARMLSEVIGCCVPSGRVRIALFPGLKIRVACRGPSASDTTLARATGGVCDVRSTTVTAGSGWSRITSSSVV